MKAALIRLGIRGSNPKLKKAAGRLKDLRTPEGEPIPPNTLAELVATWSADGWSVIRSSRSRRHAWSVSSCRLDAASQADARALTLAKPKYWLYDGK